MVYDTNLRGITIVLRCGGCHLLGRYPWISNMPATVYCDKCMKEKHDH